MWAKVAEPTVIVIVSVALIASPEIVIVAVAGTDSRAVAVTLLSAAFICAASAVAVPRGEVTYGCV